MKLPHLIKCYGCRKYFNPLSDRVSVLAGEALREKDNLILVEDANFLCDPCSNVTPPECEQVYKGELVVILDVS